VTGLIITYNHTDAGDGQKLITYRMPSKLYRIDLLITQRR